LGSLSQIHPAFFVATRGIVTTDLVVAAQCGDSLSCPTIAPTCEDRVAIEYTGDDIISADARQQSHTIDDLGRGLRVILTATTSRQTKLGVRATLPMNDQDDFPRLGINIGDYFVDQ